MATQFVTTKGNHDTITLSVDTHGMKATTSIFLNSSLLKTINNSFQDQTIGISKDLNENAITITTQVYRHPSNVEVSRVDYLIKGGMGVSPDNPNYSIIPFDDIAPIVSHFMMYYFVQSEFQSSKFKESKEVIAV
jgi:hypothetical protein